MCSPELYNKAGETSLIYNVLYLNKFIFFKFSQVCRPIDGIHTVQNKIKKERLFQTLTKFELIYFLLEDFYIRKNIPTGRTALVVSP